MSTFAFSPFPQTPRRSRSGGFTLIEILAVLGIAAVLGALVLGAFSTLQSNNRRSSCQGNMATIYRALRLYYDDYNEAPSYDPTSSRSGGLWALWAFSDPSKVTDTDNTTLDGWSLPQTAKFSLSSYLRSSNPLHCPADTRAPEVLNANGDIVSSYLSYQTLDGTDQTYQPSRTNNLADADYLRQLAHRVTISGAPPYGVNAPTPSTTIITWCPFHRGLGQRSDNVLFWDGVVKRMPQTQSGCTGGDRTSWRRLPDCSTQ